MSKIKLALDVVEDLKRLAGSIETLVKAMETGGYREDANPRKSVIPESGEKITIEKVRAVLAAKSESGKMEAVRELINRYGAAKLTEVDPEKYGDMLKEAEGL